MADDRNMRAALAYARTGWRVFPLVPGEKVPAIRHGVHDASSDPRQIRAWWERNPERNVAIACGHPGPDVLDVDRKPDGTSGFPALRQLREAGLITDPRALIRTPNDGAHLYYRATPGAGNGSLRSAHIDHRGEGGYVVAPPSEARRAADARLRPYIVVHHQASTDAINWAAIREFLEPRRERQWEPPAHLRDGGRQNLDHLVEQMAGLDDGRKQYLFWAANRILDHGQPERLADLERAARQAGSDPRQIARTIESAKQTARQDPHVSLQPRGLVQLASRREPERGPVERIGRQEEPQRSRGADLEVDRDGPEPGDRPKAATTEHPGAEPASREPEREREDQADAEPGADSERSREAGRPFAQAETESEREAGE